MAASRIVQAILAMAHSLDMKVTAEGVETVQQLTMLRALGCDEFQGFLLGRPIPAELIPTLSRPAEPMSRRWTELVSDDEAVSY